MVGRKALLALLVVGTLAGCEEPRDFHREALAQILDECKAMGGDGIIKPEHIGKSGLTISFGRNLRWACARQEVSGVKTLAVFIMQRADPGYVYEVRK